MARISGYSVDSRRNPEGRIYVSDGMDSVP
jgi:hypothetical protein